MTLLSDHDLTQEYTKIVYPTGVLASKRLNEKYFRKYGYGEIYDLILDRTNFIEAENMFGCGYDRFWDSGNLKFISK